MDLNELDRRLINRLSGDLPSERRPFAALACELGVREREILERIRSYSENALLRRVAAIVAHQRAGFVANALVAWRVPEQKIAEVGETMAAFEEVSHCYERLSYPHWPYTIYTMIHGRNRDQCMEVVERIAARTGVDDYVVLFTVKEFKKQSMRYFDESREVPSEDAEKDEAGT
jgi:DNA-binding Lrp family transcriptional regulator